MILDVLHHLSHIYFGSLGICKIAFRQVYHLSRSTMLHGEISKRPDFEDLKKDQRIDHSVGGQSM